MQLLIEVWKTVGYRYINIDDGFFGWRDDGILILIPSVFPTDWKTSLNIYMTKV